MSTEAAHEPLVLDLDEDTWTVQIDRASVWLGETLLAQEKFRKFAEGTAASIHEPHIRTYLQEIAERARAHEELLREMTRAIGREPSEGRSLAGTLLAKGGELIADGVGFMGGARGNWKACGNF
jgi:hypothetical protein